MGKETMHGDGAGNVWSLLGILLGATKREVPAVFGLLGSAWTDTSFSVLWKAAI